MTPHLSSDELVAALDGGSHSAEAAHLAECAECRAALLALEAMANDVRAASAVPEPSPLFWDHLSERIREATVQAPAPGVRSWWLAIGRPLTAAGAIAAVVLLVVIARQPSPEPGRPGAADGAGSGSAREIETSWDEVVDMASSLSSEDVRLIVGSAPAAPAVAELTPSERAAFVRMLGIEMLRSPQHDMQIDSGEAG